MGQLCHRHPWLYFPIISPQRLREMSVQTGQGLGRGFFVLGAIEDIAIHEVLFVNGSVF